MRTEHFGRCPRTSFPAAFRISWPAAHRQSCSLPLPDQSRCRRLLPAQSSVRVSWFASQAFTTTVFICTFYSPRNFPTKYLWVIERSGTRVEHRWIRWSVHVPNKNQTRLASGGDGFAVRRHRDRGHAARFDPFDALESCDFSPTPCVPSADRIGRLSGSQEQRSFTREQERRPLFIRSWEHRDLTVLLGVDDHYVGGCGIAPPDGDQFSVRRNRQ